MYRYYKIESPRAAMRMREEAIKASKRLISWPNMGRIDPEFSDLNRTVRSFVILGGIYRLIYFMIGDRLYIARLWDCRQDPERLKL